MFTAIAYGLGVPIVRTADLAERLLEYVFYRVEEQFERIYLDVVAPFFQKVNLHLVDSASAMAVDSEFGRRAAIAAVLGAPAARSVGMAGDCA